MITVQDVYAWLDARAPFASQLDFDNSGLLIGSGKQQVMGIHAALDCTDAVLDEMKRNGANLLITHHPVMFDAIRRITSDQPESRLLMRMIRENVSMIAAHTNLDQAPGGINDVLASAIGLRSVEGEGFIRIGNLPEEMSAARFAEQLRQALGDAVRLMGDPEKRVRRIGVSSGAGGGSWADAAGLGAQGFVSGEIRHHLALAAAAEGVVMFECGHHATEEPGLFALADALQNDALVVKSDIRVTKSRAGAYCTAG